MMRHTFRKHGMSMLFSDNVALCILCLQVKDGARCRSARCRSVRGQYEGLDAGRSMWRPVLHRARIRLPCRSQEVSGAYLSGRIMRGEGDSDRRAGGRAGGSPDVDSDRVRDTCQRTTTRMSISLSGVSYDRFNISPGLHPSSVFVYPALISSLKFEYCSNIDS